MQPKQEHITPLQFMSAVACFIQASALLTSFFLPIIGHEGWLSVIAGKLIYLPIIFVYLALSKRFPGKNLIEIFETVFGRVGGFVVSLMIIISFITLTSLNTRDMGQLVKQTIMVETPPVVLTTICLLVCAYAIYHGIHVVMRYSVVFTVLALFIAVTASLLTLNLWNLDHFLPLLNQPPMRYVQSFHISATIPSGELLGFLMIIPHVKQTKKGLTRYFLGGYAIGSLTILAIVVRDTAVLGNLVSFFNMPPFETQRMASLGEGLTRMEILYIIVMIVLLFFKILVHFYATVTATAQFLKLKSYHPIVLVMGALFIAYAIFVFTSSTRHSALGLERTATLWTFLSVILPLLTLVTAALRKLPQNKHQCREAG